MEKKIEVVAFYERDSKRFHRFVIQDPERLVTGVIYTSKVIEPPETLVISLRTDKKDEDLLWDL
jgi:hypothetical protein